MPLTPPPPREPIHTRHVTCQGFRCADGLWQVEGHLTDVKSYEFSSPDRGQVAAGEPVHEMWIRLTLDDELVIRSVEAVTDHAPFPLCPAITPKFQRLKGLAIRRGFLGKLREVLGGIEGCTHLVELMGPVATTAFQTIFPYRERLRRQNAIMAGPPPESQRRLLNSCHALASDGAVVKRLWPEAYTGS